MLIDEHLVTNCTAIDRLLNDTTKKLLFCMDSNPNHPINIGDYRYNTRIQVLSGNAKDFVESKNLVYFPFWYAQQLLQHNYQNKSRIGRFSFLSRQPRPHRLYLYQKIKKHITANDCIAVHANNIENYQPMDPYQCINLYEDLPYFTPLGMDTYHIDLYKNNFDICGDITNQHHAYSACFNINGESQCDNDNIFFSEKTWKALRSYCMLITYGNLGSCDMLTKFGFCMDYDIDLPCVEKASYIETIIQHWNYDFYLENLSKVEHNFNHFYSTGLKKMFSDYLRCKLEL